MAELPEMPDHADIQRLHAHVNYLGRQGRGSLAMALEAVITRAEMCHDGDCEVSREVEHALIEVGHWDEIDGDGTPASVLADHVRQLDGMGH